jgi:hypothetical protein
MSRQLCTETELPNHWCASSWAITSVFTRWKKTFE